MLLYSVESLARSGDLDSLLGRIPSEPEAECVADSRGVFEFRDCELGAKLLFAETDGGAVGSRGAVRVLDGIPLTSEDVTLLDVRTIDVAIDSEAAGGSTTQVELAPVWPDLWRVVPSWSAAETGASARLSVLGRADPKFVAVRVRPGNAAWCCRLEKLDDGKLRASIPDLDADVAVRVPSALGSRVTITIDDLEFEQPAVVVEEIRVVDGVAHLRAAAGRRIGITLESTSGAAYAERTGATPEGALLEPTRVRSSSRTIRLDGLASSPVDAVGRLSMRAAIGSASASRLSLLRGRQSLHAPVQDGSIECSPSVQVRFPVIDVLCDDGSWLRLVRSGSTDESSYAPLSVVEAASLDVRTPNAFDLVEVVGDDGSARELRSGPSRLASFGGLTRGSGYVIHVSQGPHDATACYPSGAMAVRDSERIRVTVTRAEIRPVGGRVSGILGFVRGSVPSDAELRVFCQPSGNPRGLQSELVDGNRFFHFPTGAGGSFVLVAQPQVEEGAAADVAYAKSIVYGVSASPGAETRADVWIHPGSVRLEYQGGSLDGTKLGLFRVQGDEEILTWSWMGGELKEIRNLPSAAYFVRPLEGVRSDARVAEFVITDGARSEQIVVR